MGLAKAPVLESVRAAIAFARDNLRRVAPALAIVAVLDLLTATQTSGLGFFLAQALVQVAAIVPVAALYRLAFAEEHAGDPEFRLGPGGIQWRRAETNLLGAGLLLLLLACIAFLFWLMLVFIIAAGVAFATQGGAAVTPTGQLSPQLREVVIWMSVGLMVLIMAAFVHLCLFQAATVSEQKVQVLSTWKLVRGEAWRVFAALLVIVAPFMAIAVLLTLLPEAMRLGAAVAIAVLDAFGRVPLLAGLYAHLYKRLRTAPALAEPGAAALAGPWG